MITEFRLYEMNENELEVGDYVICGSQLEDEYEFIKDKVGQIIKIDNTMAHNKFLITYNNIPDDIADGKIKNDNYIRFRINYILHYGKDKEKLELILKSNKFNI
jgi:hypothetical protein